MNTANVFYTPQTTESPISLLTVENHQTISETEFSKPKEKKKSFDAKSNEYSTNEEFYCSYRTLAKDFPQANSMNEFSNDTEVRIHSATPPPAHSYSPMSEDIIAAGGTDGVLLFPRSKNISPVSTSSHTADRPTICNTSSAKNNSPLPCAQQRTCSYESTEGDDKQLQSNTSYGGLMDNCNLKQPIHTYSPVAFNSNFGTKAFSNLPSLTSYHGVANPHANKPSFNQRPSIYSPACESSLFQSGTLHNQPLVSIKNGFPTPSAGHFYASNQQTYNPFGATPSYGGQYPCEYSVSSGSCTASSSYGYIASPSELWNSASNAAIAYDPSSVAAAAAAAAAAAINYPMPINSSTSYHMGGISNYQCETRECAVCGTGSAASWGRDANGHYICNSCGVWRGGAHLRTNTKTKGKLAACRRQVCSNCSTTVTTLWRRSPEGNPVCNACGLYQKLHGVSRPITMKKDSIQTRKRKPKGQSKSKTVRSKQSNNTFSCETNKKSMSSSASPARNYNIIISQSNSLDNSNQSTSEKRSTSASVHSSASLLDTSYMTSGLDNLSSISTQDRSSISPVPTAGNDMSSVYLGSSPDSGIGNVNTSSLVQRTIDTRLSPSGLNFSPTASYNQSYDELKQHKTSVKHGVFAPLYHDGRTGETAISCYSPLISNTQPVCAKTMDNIQLTSIKQISETSTNSTYNDLTTLYSESSLGGATRDTRRHFHQYHPYARHPAHQPLVKAEPAVM